MDKYTTRLAAALALVTTAAPAFANVVPEPGTISIFGVAVAGLIIAQRFRRRK